jgi:MYXO-CTERM domain-containing protein
LHLRFEDGVDGEPAGNLPDDSADVDNPGAGINDPTYAAATFGAEVPGTGEPNALALHLDGDANHYVEVPHHPILSFGHTAFTIEGWVRLDTLAAGLTGFDRKYLVLKKTEGQGDGFTSYAFLVQSGAAALSDNRFGKQDGMTGHELALAFGNPEATTDVMFFLISHLEITDDQWHYVAVAFDPEADEARFHLDDQVDVVEYDDPRPLAPAHFENRAPLTLGAHLDANGGVDNTLDGHVDEIRISRGVVPQEQLLNGDEAVDTVAGLTYTLDLGVHMAGEEPIEACFQVANTAGTYAHLLVGDVDVSGVDDPQITVAGGSFGPVPAGGATDCFSVVLDPAVEGELEGQEIRITARAYTYEFAAVGGPITLQLEGAVVADADDDDGDDDDDDDDWTPAPTDDDGVDGCGCSGAPVPSSGSAAGMILGLALALVLRRRS